MKLDVEDTDGKKFRDKSLLLWNSQLSFNRINMGVPVVMAGSLDGCNEKDMINSGIVVDGYSDLVSHSACTHINFPSRRKYIRLAIKIDVTAVLHPVVT